MPVSSEHPEYTRRKPSWMKVRDTVEGEEAIREKITTYLPVPPALRTDTSRVNIDTKQVSSFHNRYSFYASFAEFPEIVSDTINGLQGMVHEKPPIVELPEKMQYLLKKATPDGDNISTLWEMITRELMITGRYILLREIDEETDLVHFCTYVGESMINWRLFPKIEGGAPFLTVFREEQFVTDPDDFYKTKEVTFYRELFIDPDDNTYKVRLWARKGDNAFEDPVLVEIRPGESEITPSIFGQTFDKIPVTVLNAIDEGYDFGPVPALGMAKRAISIFRKSADYFRALFMKGDPQPILFGVDEEEAPDEIGGGILWVFQNPDGKAMFLDIDGDGIPLMREAIDAEYRRFFQETGRMLDTNEKNPAESGEAIRRKQASRQVTLKSLVMIAGDGFEAALRDLGRMLGLEETVIEQIVFKPNLDFTEPTLTGDELLKLVTAQTMGAPLSDESVHKVMQRGRLTDKTFDDEMEAIDDQPPNLALIGDNGINTGEEE